MKAVRSSIAAQTEEILAGLGKRVFLMNNVHDDAPIAFESRWALSYLRGPLTRAQIKTLMSSRSLPARRQRRRQAPKPRAAASQRTVLPPEISQRFIPSRGQGAGIVYQPVILGSAQVRYVDTKTKVDYVEDFLLAAPVRDDSMPVEWDECFETEGGCQ